MSNNGHTPTHSPAVDRYLAAKRPRAWKDLSSAQRAEQMDAALSMLSDVTEAHNRLNRAVVDYMAAQMERIETLEREVAELRSRFVGQRGLKARLLWLVAGR